MKRDVKALIAGLVCWLLGLVTIPLATAHRQNFDLPPTSTDLAYHWTGILGFVPLLPGSLAVSGAAVSFAGRFDARKAAKAGLLYVGPAALYSLIFYGRQVHTFAWVFLLVPWFVLLISGALLLLTGIFGAIAGRVRS